jgi:hypothetical protein
MRPIRLLILLLAIALTLVLALVRPLQGRANRAAKWHLTHAAGVIRRDEPRPHLTAHSHGAAPTFGYRVVSYARHFIGIPYS